MTRPGLAHSGYGADLEGWSKDQKQEVRSLGGHTTETVSPTTLSERTWDIGEGE